MKKVTIGIDIGTSGCKVIALDAEGTIAASALESYPLYQPQEGWTEQDPEDWWQASVNGIKGVLAQLGGAEVAGIGFSGQMHGMVAMDSEMRVIRRAILWNDQRTQKQCDEITAAAGGRDKLLDYTDNMMLTGYTGGKILWMRENEPENFEKTKLILNPKDYIRFRMTGELCTEVSDASGTGLFSVKERRWSYELMEILGLSRDLFPEVLESTDRAGSVTKEAAELIGIEAGIPVFAGGGDAVISTIGLGLALPGKVGVTLGTSGIVATGLPGYAPNPGGKLQVFCANNPGTWLAFGCTLSAAGSYQWYHDNLGGGAGFKELDDGAAQVAPGCGGLTFLPYLTGERCPHFDPNARGAFIGIHSSMTQGHFSRAVLEGVCYAQKQVFDIIKASSPDLSTDSIAVAGGGAKSPLWQQILADVFNMPVRTVFGSAEGGSFGAALIARVGCGMASSMEEAMSLVSVKSEVLPIAENVGIYAEQYNRYCAFYPAIKHI